MAFRIRTIGEMTDEEGDFYGVTLQGDISAVKGGAKYYDEDLVVIPAALLEEAVKALEDDEWALISLIVCFDTDDPEGPCTATELCGARECEECGCLKDKRDRARATIAKIRGE